MGLLSTQMLGTLKRVANASMTSTCQIQRKTDTADGAGGFTSVWATSSTVACRIEPDTSQATEAVAEERLRGINRFHVAVPVGTDVTPTDRLVIDGTTLEVTSVQTPRTYLVEILLQAKTVV